MKYPRELSIFVHVLYIAYILFNIAVMNCVGEASYYYTPISTVMENYTTNQSPFEPTWSSLTSPQATPGPTWVSQPLQEAGVSYEAFPDMGGFFNVSLNQPPRIIALDSAPQDSMLILSSVSAFDPDSDKIYYKFRLNSPETNYEWQDLTGWIESNTCRWALSETGDSQIEAWVRDGMHAGPFDYDDKRTEEFAMIQPNQPPALTALSSDKLGPQESRAVVVWSVEAADPENDQILFQFWLNGRIVRDWSPDNRWTWTTTEANIGENQVEAKIVDTRHAAADGFDDSRAVSFTVASPNQKPAITNFGADRNSPQEAGSAITWTAEAADPEKDRILYMFLLNSRPATDWTSQNQWTWTASEESVGNNQIEVRIRDDMHAGPDEYDDQRSASFTITAPNAPPAVSGLTSDKQSPQEAGTPIKWTASGNDPDGDPILYRFWLKNSSNNTDIIVRDWSYDNTWVWANRPEDIGNYTITVNARDENHFRSNNSFLEATYELLTPNLPPKLTALNPDKQSPQYAGTSIKWTASADDSDGDPILYRFWLKNSNNDTWNIVRDWSSANTWTWTNRPEDSDTYTISVDAKDGNHLEFYDSSLSETYKLLPLNLPPKLIALNSDKQSPQEAGTVVIWTAEATDPEGDFIQFRFFLDGQPITDWTLPNSTKSILLPDNQWSWTTTETGKGDRQIEVRIRDGAHAGPEGFDDEQMAHFTIIKPLRNISGITFSDQNGDGVKDNNEPGLAGWIINLAQPDGSEASTTTGEDGSYRFEDLSPGTYTVCEVTEAGWSQTLPADGSYTIELKDADITSRDFGNQLISYSISGTKFFDQNGNGIMEDNEIGMEGWTIQLFQDNTVISITTTAQDGSYSFRNLTSGEYSVSDISQDGWEQTVPKDSYHVELKYTDETGKDFGNRGNMSITGVKFYDLNSNGVQNQDEPGLPGLEVKLAKEGTYTATTTTGVDGSYTFRNLIPGTYKADDLTQVTATSEVVVNIPAIAPYKISGVLFNDQDNNEVKGPGESGVPDWGINLVYVTPGPAQDIALGQVYTDANGAYEFPVFPGTYRVSEPAKPGWTPTTAADLIVTVISSDVPNQNFGNRMASPTSLSSVLGTKFNDFNRNGDRDPGEPGMAGWTIQLSQGGTVIKTETTAADGSYNFLNLLPGDYVLGEVDQPGWVQSKPAVDTGDFTYSLTLASGEIKLGVDFGNYLNNSPPINPTLVPNQPSPQKTGTSITWTAGATDPDKDKLQFRFLLKGPSTGDTWAIKRNWDDANTWTWTTTSDDVGVNLIEVGVSDGRHAGADGYDCNRVVELVIKANQMPTITSLNADKLGPQRIGTEVTWTAQASDPENDRILYRFFLDGSPVTDWTTKNVWTWTASKKGTSKIGVGIRDGKHLSEDKCDAYQEIVVYQINPFQSN